MNVRALVWTMLGLEVVVCVAKREQWSLELCE
jgi:hypothetical protein